MESLGILAGGMAHDMNNILASIMAVASAMEAEMPTDSSFHCDVRDIMAACRRGSRLTRSLLSFARRHRLNNRVFSLNSTISEVESILSRTVPRGISIVLDLDDRLANVLADSDQMNQIILNVCINAVDAMGDSGRLTIETHNVSIHGPANDRSPALPPGQYARVVIRDTGTGIPREYLERIFEPFFTTKSRGKGTGLGLSIAYGTLSKLGGAIHVGKSGRSGTEMIIDLPSVESGVEPAIESASQMLSMPSDRAGTVLLVDDEPLFRFSARRILEKMGYTVIGADNGEEAVALFEQNLDAVDFVILDMIMPVLGGRETFYRLRNLRPDIPVIIASGYTDEESIRDILADGASAFISKPFDLRSLSEVLPSAGNQKSL
jgi:nitrogen-specific signal transduction histidine kinase